MMPKKLNLEKIILIADIVIGVIFIGLIIALIIRGTQKPVEVANNTSEEQKESKKPKKPETNNTTEDDADADDSVATRQFNTELVNDGSTFITLITQYQANNRGAVPTTEEEWAKFNRNYLETAFQNKYKFVHCDFELGNCVLPQNLTWQDNANTIYTALHANCNDKALEYATGKRKLSIYFHLKGESNGTYCMNN